MDLDQGQARLQTWTLLGQETGEQPVRLQAPLVLHCSKQCEPPLQARLHEPTASHSTLQVAPPLQLTLTEPVAVAFTAQVLPPEQLESQLAAPLHVSPQLPQPPLQVCEHTPEQVSLQQGLQLL